MRFLSYAFHQPHRMNIFTQMMDIFKINFNILNIFRNLIDSGFLHWSAYAIVLANVMFSWWWRFYFHFLIISQESDRKIIELEIVVEISVLGPPELHMCFLPNVCLDVCTPTVSLYTSLEEKLHYRFPSNWQQTYQLQ